MNLKCQKCDKTFPSNTSLYMHNERAHTPSLLLLNHSHDDDGSGNRHSPNDGDDNIPGSKRKFNFDESVDDIPLSIRKRKPKKESKPPNIIDEDEVIPGVKRKGIDDDVESIDDIPLSIRRQKPKEPKLEIIEPYPKPDSEESSDKKLNYKA